MTIRDLNNNSVANAVFRENSTPRRRNWIKQLISHLAIPMDAVGLNNSPEKSWLSL